MYIYVYIYKPTSRRKQKSDFWGLHNLMMMSFIVFFFFHLPLRLANWANMAVPECSSIA